MKRIILIYLLLLTATLPAIAQTTPLRMQGNPNNPNRDQFGNQVDPNTQPESLEDSTSHNLESLPPKLYMWRIHTKLGERILTPADTLSLNFQRSNLAEGETGHYNYLGNLGSPRQSHIFFLRREDAHTPFIEGLTQFLKQPDELYFTNSNVPYTNLTYYKAGDKVSGEERFKSYFSVNVNKRFAFGFNVDYLYGRGQYANQATSYFNGGLFASYVGQRYEMHAVYNNFFMKTNENGGITNDGYITRPDTLAEGKKEYEANNIPVRMEQTTNRNKHFYLYLTHRYRLGFTKREMVIDTLSKDTTQTAEFVPVTSFIHTLKVERSNHQFRAGTEPSDLYEQTYFGNGSSRDSTLALSMKNTFGIALLEGFNKYAKAGLTAYVSHKLSRYELMDSVSDRLTGLRRAAKYNEQELFLGGELAKRQGTTLHYTLLGEVGVLDKAMGQFNLQANIDLNFRLGKDTVNFYARGYLKNTLPSFYLRHYHSNHYWWDKEDMDKELRTRIEGELNIERWQSNLKFGIENIKNYTYLNGNSLPTQYDGNVQVLSATLRQNFRLGIFHLENEVTWQKSTEESVLPLPQLSLYHNLYLQTAVAKKVLGVQLGADVRYFSKYNAPAYTPALQQFHLQADNDRVEIGGYPLVNVYANLMLKRTRIFVMMYHVNAGMGSRNYFTVPHYPLNPRLLKIGLSWNFYD